MAEVVATWVDQRSVQKKKLSFLAALSLSAPSYENIRKYISVVYSLAFPLFAA